MSPRALVLLMCALCALREATAMGGGDGGGAGGGDGGGAGGGDGGGAGGGDGGGAGGGGGGGDSPAQGEPAGAEDMRCKRVTCDADERDFWVFLTSFTGDGFYEESDIVVEKGAYNGVLMPAGNLSAEIPVRFEMKYKSGDTYETGAVGCDSLQGLLEKFQNVITIVNCFLNPKIDLPMEKPQNGLELAGCELFPRLFAPNFPLGKYYIQITHECDELGEEYCGSIRVDFELKAKADD